MIQTTKMSKFGLGTLCLKIQDFIQKLECMVNMRNYQLKK